MTPETQRPGRALLWIILLITSVALLLGYALKANCTDRPWDGRQWTTLCANDVDLLYSLNDLQHIRTFPPEHIEYPPVVVLLVGATATLAHSAAGFVQLNGLVAAASGLAVAAMLTRLAPGRRSLIFALGPPLVLYSFQNWDLLAVALTIGCFYLLFGRASPAAAGISLGLGAAVKLFPALLLPVLI
ncbi:MAG: glycosyltransferase 87 family protein, partial [Actinomycetota bacterium]|nr:glycosyltransferase 87 family protein [Actinomycetota bacterium]